MRLGRILPDIARRFTQMVDALGADLEQPESPRFESFDAVAYELFLTFGLPLERNHTETGRAELLSDLEDLQEQLEQGPLNSETSPEEHTANCQLVARALRFFAPGGPFYSLDNWPIIH